MFMADPGVRDVHERPETVLRGRDVNRVDYVATAVVDMYASGELGAAEGERAVSTLHVSRALAGS